MNLSLNSKLYTVCRLEAGSALPSWTQASGFISITKTEDELSIVCEESCVPATEIKCERDWRMLKVQGPLDFSLTGILASIASPLAEAKISLFAISTAEAKISLFAISTFDTDYILVKSKNLKRACETLQGCGFKISEA